MTKAPRLTFHIALPLLCVFITQAFTCGQTKAVVAPRLSFDVKGALGVAFNPISKLLAVRREGTVQIIDITDGREQAVLALARKEPVALHWSSDGERLLVRNEKTAVIWEARSGRKLATLAALPQRWDYWLEWDIKWSPDGKTILALKVDDSIKANLLDRQKTTAQLWNIETGKLVVEINIKGIEGSAQFSPDGKQLLTTSGKDDAKLWEVASGRLLATLTPPERQLMKSSDGVFSPDGRFVVVQNYGRGIFAWDSTTRLLKATIIEDEFQVTTSCYKGFSPDGKLLAVYRERLKGWDTITSIELREVATGALRSTLTGTNMMYSAQQWSWSSDNQTFVTGGGQKKYDGKIWDVGTGRLRATIPMVAKKDSSFWAPGYSDLDHLSIHPTLPVISAVNNNFVRFWSSETGALLQTLEKTGGPAQWSADGKLYVTFDAGVARVWDVVKSN